jgi:hypothetical protein
MARRQIKKPRKDGSENEIDEAPSQHPRAESAGICSRWIGKRKALIRQRKPLTRGRRSSRRVIRPCRCRCMTVSVTRTHWWSCRSPHVDR